MLAVVMSVGCGYQLVGQRGVVPGGTTSIRVGDFQNHSRVVGLDEQLIFALEREFYRRGVVRVVEGGAEADAELKGGDSYLSDSTGRLRCRRRGASVRSRTKR